MAKELMLGNEAIARGAFEAGVHVVSSYPGTPSTEITETVAKYPQVYVEWATNEKVALEVACGASFGGARAMACMKHVGVNVASDPLFTAAYTGVNGGLLIACADDPAMHSSQNEQDSRNYAKAAHVIMLEPSDSQECKDFAKEAFALSERFDTPVMLRITTRIAHARSMVEIEQRQGVEVKSYQKDAMKYVMMPGMARARHLVVETREKEASRYVNDCALNRVEMRDKTIGVVCAGVTYQYVREALPNASICKLGVVYPLPRQTIEAFAQSVDALYVIEELEPFIEEQIASWGIAVQGKNLTGRQGELSVRRVREAFGLPTAKLFPKEDVPGRPPLMCAGCPHRGPFTILKKLGATVTGDIGCYTLGALKPVASMDMCLCMGASIGMAQGLYHARGAEFAKKTVAIIGDSTFMHSGITSLVNAAYNQAHITVMILDNTTTGMTGHQPNPATGFNIHNEPTSRVDLAALCRACGVRTVTEVDAFDLRALEDTLRRDLAMEEPTVIIARRPCALLDKKRKPQPFSVDAQACVGCHNCMKLSCPAIETAEKKVSINPVQCVGCGLCLQMCKFGAIKEAVKPE